MSKEAWLVAMVSINARAGRSGADPTVLSLLSVVRVLRHGGSHWLVARWELLCTLVRAFSLVQPPSVLCGGHARARARAHAAMMLMINVLCILS